MTTPTTTEKREEAIAAYNYGSHTLGESKDDDRVYVVSDHSRHFRIHELYEELKNEHPEQDICVFDSKAPLKDGIYPHTPIPHIFSECIRHTTPVEGIWNYSHKVVAEIQLLFKGGIESMIEGEPQKGIFKLLQFIAMQRNLIIDHHAVVCDTTADMFTKSGLCRLTGLDIYNSETKCFDVNYVSNIVEIASVLLGSPVIIDINNVVYIEACTDTSASCGTIDEGVMPFGNMEDVCCDDAMSLRDLLAIDENRENLFSTILKNENISIRSNADIKYRVYGETRWDI